MSLWIDDITAALQAIGGAGAYDEIYAEVAARRSDLPPSWQEIIRRTIQQHSSDSSAYETRRADLFHSRHGIGQGYWALRTSSEASDMRAGIAENSLTNQGYLDSSVVRKAIEKHAVNAAIVHYRARGATEIKELGKPYDLKITLPSRDIHVEVKGSLRELDTVILTRNEVQHAQETPGTELIVVDQIHLRTSPLGQPETTGGRLRSWHNWAPSEESLVALTFSHVLS